MAFEAHALDCPACFRDLKTLDKVGVLIQEILASSDPFLAGLRASLARSNLARRTR